ncbi:hypothetical protein FACS1894188_05680 [Clostridia bacterium]|nr:hypothetical protein FACS1894188_05680 [Clostridia bacterium]
MGAYNALNACFKQGMIKGELKSNLMFGVKLPKSSTFILKKIEFLEQDEVDKLYNLALTWERQWLPHLVLLA